MTNIIVPKGIVPVHMFDVWGVLVDADKMGEKKIQAYAGWARDNGIDPQEAATVIADYRALTRGEPWATGTRKVEIIQALQGPIEKAGIKVPYNGCFLEDGIYAVRTVLDAGEGASIFSSGNNAEMRQDLPEDIAARVGRFYDVSKFTYQTSQKKRTKSEAPAFVELVGLEKAIGRQVVSHTADELPEVAAAAQSGAIPAQNIVYVNRNNVNSVEKVLAAGVGRYVDNLRDVDYRSMATKEN
jgi:hypothetical protein